MVMREDPVERDAWILIGSLIFPQPVIMCSYDQGHLERVRRRANEIVGRDLFEVEQ